MSLRNPGPSPLGTTALPLRLILHLASPPVEKLLLSPSQEACKQAFMGQIKEADFIRWGSTKRVTGLRKNEQDGIWEGIKERECSMDLVRSIGLLQCGLQTTLTTIGASRRK